MTRKCPSGQKFGMRRGVSMEIERKSYLEEIKIRENNGMVKIITGVRRCGKS